jgi:hypothetical protein
MSPVAVPDLRGAGLVDYRRVKIPEEIMDRPTTGLEGAAYETENLVSRSTSRRAPKSEPLPVEY